MDPTPEVCVDRYWRTSNQSRVRLYDLCGGAADVLDELCHGDVEVVGGHDLF